MNRLSILILSVFAWGTTIASEDLPPTNKPPDEPTAVSAKQEKDISVLLSIASKKHEIEFWDSSFEYGVAFKPNNAYLIYSSINYNNKEFILAFQDFTETGVDDDKGDSDYLNLQFSHYLESFEIRYFYEKYKGFYVSNQRNPVGGYFVFPDIKTEHFGIELSYYSNTGPELFRMTSLINDDTDVVQKESSLVYGLLLDQASINDFPENAATLSQIRHSELIFFKDARLTTIAPFIGIVGLRSEKDFFMQGGTKLGYGYQQQKYRKNGREKTRNDGSLTFSIFGGAGLKYDNRAIGFFVRYDSVEPSIEDTEFTFSTYTLALYFMRTF